MCDLLIDAPARHASVALSTRQEAHVTSGAGRFPELAGQLRPAAGEIRRAARGSECRAGASAVGGDRWALLARASIMWSTACFTRSSGTSTRPPLAGIMPAVPVKPWMAWSYSTSLPLAMRGAQPHGRRPSARRRCRGRGTPCRPARTARRHSSAGPGPRRGAGRGGRLDLERGIVLAGDGHPGERLTGARPPLSGTPFPPASAFPAYGSRRCGPGRTARSRPPPGCR